MRKKLIVRLTGTFAALLTLPLIAFAVTTYLNLQQYGRDTLESGMLVS
ncbi:MAG: hypothetical protein LBU58_10695 [Clostridiales bacterium]|jgi:hypothetical protein|nr:hypothetical protein [Clostridiales bacterium]